MEVINAVTISEFFLSKRCLTPKKIQKLVYYAYAWFIALNNQSSNNIENTSSGWNEVPQTKEPNLENDDLKSFLNDVWNKFEKYSTDQLEYMTHQELPWINARNNISSIEPSNNIITKKDIFTYYNSLIDA